MFLPKAKRGSAVVIYFQDKPVDLRALMVAPPGQCVLPELCRWGAPEG